MSLFLFGCIVGLLIAQYLPGDLVQYIDNTIKIKKSTVKDITVDLPKSETKKPGLFKRIFRKRTTIVSP